MSTTYERADAKMHARVRAIMEQHHAHLVEAGVSFCVVWATGEKDDNGKPKAPTLKHGGYPAYATAKITKARERAAGQADTLITIDAYSWSKLSPQSQDAVIDHELTHFAIVTGADGGPRLVARKHDFQVGWFHEIAERHGEYSIEAIQMRALVDEKGQLYFPWCVPKGDADLSAAIAKGVRAAARRRSKHDTSGGPEVCA